MDISELAQNLIEDAHRVLEVKGIEIESPRVTDILSGAGCTIIEEQRKGHKAIVARISANLVETSMASAPRVIDLYSTTGDLAVSLGKSLPAFSTGSAGITYLDAESVPRRSTAADLGNFIRVADYLEHVDIVSTAMVPNDIEPKIQDAYRLLEVFKNSTKPVVTGIFPQVTGSNFGRMKDMLLAICGSEEELKQKPLAVFDCAPDPLKWSKALSECIVDCGEFGIPVEFVTMPQPGLSYPATLYESVVQGVAETFAGFVISQAAHPHAPLIWGYSPMTICFERGRTDAELSSPGAIKLITAYTAVGKKYGVPTHTYAIADSPTVDVQYGIERQRIIRACMDAGIDNITGLGMLGEEDILSCEALVIDNDVVGAERYLDKGIERRRGDALGDIAFLADEAVINPKTVQYLRSDEYFSPRVFNRDRTTPMLERAIEVVDKILASHKPEYLSGEQIRDLEVCLKQ